MTHGAISIVSNLLWSCCVLAVSLRETRKNESGPRGNLSDQLTELPVVDDRAPNRWPGIAVEVNECVGELQDCGRRRGGFYPAQLLAGIVYRYYACFPSMRGGFDSLCPHHLREGLNLWSDCSQRLYYEVYPNQAQGGRVFVGSPGNA